MNVSSALKLRARFSVVKICFGSCSWTLPRAIICAHQRPHAQSKTVVVAREKIQPVCDAKDLTITGSKEGATSLQTSSIRIITALTWVSPCFISPVTGPTRTGTQSLSKQSLYPMVLRSCTTSKKRIVPKRSPLVRSENGPGEVVASLSGGQESQHR